jgi:hypothetical protein
LGGYNSKKKGGAAAAKAFFESLKINKNGPNGIGSGPKNGKRSEGVAEIGTQTDEGFDGNSESAVSEESSWRGGDRGLLLGGVIRGGDVLFRSPRESGEEILMSSLDQGPSTFPRGVGGSGGVLMGGVIVGGEAVVRSQKRPGEETAVSRNGDDVGRAEDEESRDTIMDIRDSG